MGELPAEQASVSGTHARATPWRPDTEAGGTHPAWLRAERLRVADVLR